MVRNETFDPDHRILIESLSGEITADSLRETCEQRLENPRLEAATRLLTDERAVTSYAVSGHDVREIAGEVRESAHLFEGKRWAFLVADQRTAALTLLFQQVLRDALDIRVFSTPDAALDWLDAPPDIGFRLRAS